MNRVTVTLECLNLQVCDVGTLQKPFLTRWWNVNTYAVQVIQSFNSRQKLPLPLSNGT